jgi:poly-gamma-glutamate capsule biosynthesis protein CapA/YwtB (metallophosphatase superfamily)
VTSSRPAARRLAALFAVWLIAVAGETPGRAGTPSDGVITVVIVGDIMLDRRPGEGILQGFDPLFPFRGTANLLQAADLAIGNLEVVVSTKGVAVPKAYNFRADPRVLDVLVRAGIGVVSVANNHSGDYGPEAFADMLRLLDAAGIGYAGGGLTIRDARQPLVRDVNGTRIALLAYNEVELRSFQATADRPGLAWLVDDHVREDIAAARALADFVIVYPHWGLEYQFQPSRRQREAARMMIDAGADLVVGAHPHVIQTVEYYEGKWIFYSLGNFVFDDFLDVGPELDEPSRRSWIVSLRVRKGELLSWRTFTARTDDQGEPWLLPEPWEPCAGMGFVMTGVFRCNIES